MLFVILWIGFLPWQRINLMPNIFVVAIDFWWNAAVVRWLAGTRDWQQNVFSTFSPLGKASLNEQVKKLPTPPNNNHPVGNAPASCEKQLFACVSLWQSPAQKYIFHPAQHWTLVLDYTLAQWWHANVNALYFRWNCKTPACTLATVAHEITTLHIDSESLAVKKMKWVIKCQHTVSSLFSYLSAHSSL